MQSKGEQQYSQREQKGAHNCCYTFANCTLGPSAVHCQPNKIPDDNHTYQEENIVCVKTKDRP